MGRFGLGRFGWYGPFWTLVWAKDTRRGLRRFGHFLPFPCLQPSSVWEYATFWTILCQILQSLVNCNRQPPSQLHDIVLTSTFLEAAVEKCHFSTSKNFWWTYTGCGCHNVLPQRIQYKLCLLVYGCLNGTAPGYLSDLTVSVSSTARRQLRSASTSDLVVPPIRRASIGDRAFA